MKKIALLTAILGIIAIIFLSHAIEPKTVKIASIDSTMIGEYVRVSGEISKIKQTKITSFTVKDDSSDIYAFSYEKINLTEGTYELIGKVNEYHGLMEIEIDKIRRIT